MPGFPATAVSKKLWCVFFCHTHQAVETGKSPASRAALSFREWGKPHARYFGWKLTKLRRETSRGNNDGWLKHNRRFCMLPLALRRAARASSLSPQVRGEGGERRARARREPGEGHFHDKR